ncbi:MAG: hypothetical protein CAPSK01_000978 [Candidatus Accumulibacter vicinus]|uniref:Uncharacterized protein n=1 Tax=Candidatus Accumulibacter vicinus TaxID=2954382 RepID=A0A084Y3E0_9PROT|nr:MAG: hypothetical protein CAPSK01_000978 [Candidatus Accumulibacter vicinus]
MPGDAGRAVSCAPGPRLGGMVESRQISDLLPLASVQTRSSHRRASVTGGAIDCREDVSRGMSHDRYGNTKPLLTQHCCVYVLPTAKTMIKASRRRPSPPASAAARVSAVCCTVCRWRCMPGCRLPGRCRQRPQPRSFAVATPTAWPPSLAPALAPTGSPRICSMAAYGPARRTPSGICRPPSAKPTRRHHHRRWVVRGRRPAHPCSDLARP